MSTRTDLRKRQIRAIRLLEENEREIAALPREKDAPLDLVGVTEAAEILGIKPNTISANRSRGRFPEPIVTLTCGPIWHREDIEVYAARNGR